MADRILGYPNARRYVTSKRWAVLPSTLDTICDLLVMRANGIALSEPEILARIGAGTRPSFAMRGAVAVIPLYGVIDQKIGSMAAISGGTAVDAFMEQFRQAVADPNVSAIVLDVNSPGGAVSGVPEAAEEILEARGAKRLVAVANTLIASAAYWLSCACHEIVCMPSGEVGSIGVVAVHEDFSQANTMMGYKPTYVTYGQYKAEFNSDAPLTDDATAYLQKTVDDTGDMFVKFVAKARGVSVATVKASFGQGRVLMPMDAKSVGMIDRIGTLDETIAKLSGRSGRGARAAVDVGASQGRAAVAGDASPSAEGMPSKYCECSDACPCQDDDPMHVCPDDCPTCDDACPCVASAKQARQAARAVLDSADATLAMWRRG